MYTKLKKVHKLLVKEFLLKCPTLTLTLATWPHFREDSVASTKVAARQTDTHKHTHYI